MKLIDADALPRHGNRGGLLHWKDIENAPAIDAVEVIRCKDCREYMGELGRVCAYWTMQGGTWARPIKTDPMGYCYKGKEYGRNKGTEDNCHGKAMEQTESKDDPGAADTDGRAEPGNVNAESAAHAVTG